jgi:hypothetical protein
LLVLIIGISGHNCNPSLSAPARNAIVFKRWSQKHVGSQRPDWGPDISWPFCLLVLHYAGGDVNLIFFKQYYIYILYIYIILNFIILYDIIWFYMILYDIIWYYMILYYIILYYIVLYYIIIYYIRLYDFILYILYIYHIYINILVI